MECSRSVSHATRDWHSEGFGSHSGRDPPVPIPNTEVKPASADGTWAAGPRESRSLPNIVRLGPSFGAAPIAFTPRPPSILRKRDRHDHTAAQAFQLRWLALRQVSIGPTGLRQRPELRRLEGYGRFTRERWLWAKAHPRLVRQERALRRQGRAAQGGQRSVGGIEGSRRQGSWPRRWRETW